MCYVHTMEDYSRIKRKEIQVTYMGSRIPSIWVVITQCLPRYVLLTGWVINTARTGTLAPDMRHKCSKQCLKCYVKCLPQRKKPQIHIITWIYLENTGSQSQKIICYMTIYLHEISRTKSQTVHLRLPGAGERRK